MRKTIANINCSIISQALDNAKPVSAVGLSAVESYKQFIETNVLTAASLEMSINSLTGDQYDPGLESLVHTLKGVMPEANRKVAIAYEELSAMPKGTFMQVGEDAKVALADLYNHNAKKIVGDIANGLLDQWSTNPAIAKLIAYARSAMQDLSNIEHKNRTRLANDSVVCTLVPKVKIAVLGDNSIVSVDGLPFIEHKTGELVSIRGAETLSDLPKDMHDLIEILRNMQSAEGEPNVLVFKEPIATAIAKDLGVRSLAFNLLGEFNSIVSLNGNAMSAGKAKQLLQANASVTFASLLLNSKARDLLAYINRALQVFESLRGSLVSDTYVRKLVDTAGVATYINQGTSYFAMAVANNSIVSRGLYDTVYAILGDKRLVASPAMHDTIALTYNDALICETSTANIRRQNIAKMVEERQQYEDILERILTEREELSQMSDVNPDKVEALDKLREKVRKSIATVSSEINALQQD